MKWFFYSGVIAIPIEITLQINYMLMTLEWIFTIWWKHYLDFLNFQNYFGINFSLNSKKSSSPLLYSRKLRILCLFYMISCKHTERENKSTKKKMSKIIRNIFLHEDIWALIRVFLSLNFGIHFDQLSYEIDHVFPLEKCSA